MNKFLENYYLMSFTQRETENLNNFKTIKDSKKIKTSMRKMLILDSFADHFY